MIEVKEVAELIAQILENKGFNNPQDSSGYFIVNSVEDVDYSVDAYKREEDGKEFYAVHCAYGETTDWKYTADLSIESLIDVLKEVQNSKPVRKKIHIEFDIDSEDVDNFLAAKDYMGMKLQRGISNDECAKSMVNTCISLMYKNGV